MVASIFSNSQIKGTNAEVALYTLPKVGSDFDGILKRGDKNPNLRGAKKAFEANGFDASESALDKLLNSLNSSDVVMVVVPEIIHNEDHFNTLISKVSKSGTKIALTPGETLSSLRGFDYLLPVPSFLEKDGTILNYNNADRKLNMGMSYGDISHNLPAYAKWVNV